MKTCKLLFQGDSITDADRIREDPLDLGTGYPYYAAQLLREQHPDVDFTFWNRGIGCDETQNLLARIEPDLIALQPDVVSLLIGINDTWHHADARDWMPISVFEARYRQILERIRNETKAKLMVSNSICFRFLTKRILRRTSHRSRRASVHWPRNMPTYFSQHMS